MRWILVAVLLVLGSCASVQPMAFDRSSPRIGPDRNSIVLMTATVSRVDDSRYQPRPIVIIWKALDRTDGADELKFRIDADADSVTVDGRSEILLRMALPPGHYRLLRIAGLARAFPFNGAFFVPLLLDLDVPDHALVYAGHVAATLRPRHDGEFRAGPLIPLIDQAATGISGGTFDVVVSDASAVDLPLFRSTFSALGDAPVSNAMLPPFDRSGLDDHDADGAARSEPRPAKP